MIIELNHDNFESVTSKGIVVVDFWADWCGPCRILAPTIDDLAREIDDVVFAKLNVDDYPEVASKHGVMSIPTLMYYADGELKDHSVGVVSKSVIEKKISLLR
jgi:thioredoxin 1